MSVNLVLLKRDGAHKSFPLQKGVTVIGRRRDCDLRIPLVSVSKKHCRLHYGEGAFKIQDLGSRNGTVLNGKRIEEAEIKPGDSIKVGSLAFVLQVNGQPKNFSVPASLTVPKAPKEILPTEDEIAEELDIDTFPDPDELDIPD